MSKIVHFEIPIDDAARASAFYREVLGWEISDLGDQPYWLVRGGADDEPGANGALVGRGRSASEPGSDRRCERHRRHTGRSHRTAARFSKASYRFRPSGGQPMLQIPRATRSGSFRRTRPHLWTREALGERNDDRCSRAPRLDAPWEDSASAEITRRVFGPSAKAGASESLKATSPGVRPSRAFGPPRPTGASR